MFYAYNENGKLSSLFQEPASVLQQLKKESSFYCPTCKEPLIVKSGSSTTPHFAHFPSSTCEIKNRGESEYHESGKWLLYKWLSSQGFKVEVEKFLPGIQQRPDLLFIVNSKKVAVEFQCATIPVSVIQKRTEGFRKEGIFPLWILGKNQLKRKGEFNLILNGLHKSIVYKIHGQYRMYFLDVNAKAIIETHTLGSYSSSKHFAAFKNYRLHSSSFPQLFTPSVSSVESLYPLWEQVLYRYRTIYRKHASSREKQWRQSLYLKSLHYSLIPSLCYLPVQGQVLAKVEPYIWQTRFITDSFCHTKIGEVITFTEIETISTVNEESPNVLQEYMDVLEKFDIVTRMSDKGWIKLKEVLFHNNVHEAISEDRWVVSKLKQFNIL
ncbi:competence protein CoiA [Halobacillus campisalis]|uniref:Competence protein CoiA n=1 Tax=Halobacillus campisalis TaxID=435909 RepID=A0ABW2K670_9BACI|nr:competence protein CoiA family protein [Halobacillus campisalis]